jgi:hypothetical protein
MIEAVLAGLFQCDGLKVLFDDGGEFGEEWSCEVVLEEQLEVTLQTQLADLVVVRG